MTPREGILFVEKTKDAPAREFPGVLFGAILTADQISKQMEARRKGEGIDRAFGEVVFNTAMSGYEEILTDPSYLGQMICMTYPHIGNTGITIEDHESSKSWCAGLIVREVCGEASNWRSQGELYAYLEKQGVPGISGIDTRALTRHLRDKGAIRGLILPASERNRAEELLAKLPSFEGRDMIKEVTTPKVYTLGPKKPKHRIVAIDYGIKKNMLRSLESLGCEVQVFPADATAQEILAVKPGGVFLSNGPGDPSAVPYAVKTVKDLLGKVPVFGVCMGHQILAQALGAKTYKLKFGHHGANQPVFDKKTGRVEITSQNHGYAVDEKTLPKNAQVTHVNLNDQTIEGIEVPSLKAFSVQHHPEACPGPHDSIDLFERFIQSIQTLGH